MKLNPPRPVKHRVTSTKFTPSDLNAKTLCHVRHNRSRKYTLAASPLAPDGTFVLEAISVWLEHATRQIHRLDSSLDQATVDKIETPPDSSLFSGVDYVIFEDSSKVRELYSRK